MGTVGRWVIAWLAVSAITAGAANAATITVTTTQDTLNTDGQCSLREAIGAVNSPGTSTDCGKADAGGNTIVLGAHTYPLTLELFTFRGHPPVGCFSTSESRPNDNSWGELAVAGTVHNLTIAGVGPSKTILDACKLGDRALEVKSGATVIVRGLTITNGDAQAGSAGDTNMNTGGKGADGGAGTGAGAILNDGTLTLTDTAVTNSHAGDGGSGGSGGPNGGSGGDGGDGGRGGGIYNAANATLTIQDSTLSSNAAGNGGDGGAGTAGTTAAGGSGGSGGSGSNGGALLNDDGTVRITGSTLDGNHSGSGGAAQKGQNGAATGGNGGDGGNGGSAGVGAGITADTGSLQAINDTIAGNLAGDGKPGGAAGEENGGDLYQDGQAGDGGNGGTGAGLWSKVSDTELTNVTVADNAAGKGAPAGHPGPSNPRPGTDGSDGIGGGAYVVNGSPGTTLRNTVLTNNQPGGDCRGTVTDGGHNLVFSPPSVGPLPTDVCDVTHFLKSDPKLGPLQSNAGPTLTMALGAGSAALDQVPAAGAGCPATDQRGAPRPGGAKCDIGAYERVAPKIVAHAPTSITTSSALLKADVTANQVQATVHLQFGKTTAYGSPSEVRTVAGLTPTSLSIQLKSLQQGTKYHYRWVATSSDGSTTTTDATFTTAAATPVITALKLKPAPFHVPGGTTISYTDSESSSVSFDVLRCVKLGKHGRCKSYKKTGSFVRTSHAGHNSFHFSGKLGAHKLASGHYRLDATPTAHGKRGKTAKKTFRILA